MSEAAAMPKIGRGGSAPGRNDACPCGSGRKFKHCCGNAARSGSGRSGAGENPSSGAGKTPAGRASFAASRPPPGRSLLERAARLREAGQWAQSLPLFQEYVRSHPDDSLALHDLGITYLQLRRMPGAIASLRRAVALNPELELGHYHLGVAYEQDGQEAEAIASLRRAVRLAPRHAEAQSRLGAILHLVGERAAALECFRRSAAASPNTKVGRISRGKAFLVEEKFDEAERQFRRIIALDPKNYGGHWMLGRTLAMVGRFGEAVEALERSISLRPDDPSIYYDLVTAKRIEERDRPRVAEMLAAVASPALSIGWRIGLEYALGKALDDLGDYAEAIRHFDEANRLQGSRMSFDRALFTAENDRAMAAGTACVLVRREHEGAYDETPLLIVGMPRSGTTLVEQILSRHRAVGAGGELHFWNDTAGAGVAAGGAEPTAADLAKWAADYRALLHRLAPGKLRVTDKMPANFRWLGQVHATFPKARIIHVRRHPIDTCLSNYFAYFGRQQPQACARADLVLYYREYLRLMRHWRSVLPPGRLLEIDYEALVGERERVTRELIAFAGLAWDDACLTPERNQRAVYTASSWQARQAVYRTSLERWRHYEPWLGELRELLPEAAAPAEGENSG